MPRFKSIFIFATLFMVALSVFVTNVQAAGPACTCFCYLNGQGATETSGPADATACETECKKKPGYAGQSCPTDPGGFPSSNLRCYANASDCTVDYNKNKKADGVFDSKQPAECMPGSHYCYPADQIDTTLAVEILGKTSVINFADYIGLVYKWLLGFALTAAIVFVMIGGIRYVIGASSGEIGKAKEMITKAISGLVLLMFAYIILLTVNPELIKLQVPKFPMLRRVDLLFGGESCADLIARGYTIDDASATQGTYGPRTCGAVAAVKTDKSGTAVSPGTTCTYDFCPNNGAMDSTCGTYTSTNSAPAMCIISGKVGHCVKCGQVTDDNACNIPTEAGTCSQLAGPTTYVGNTTSIDVLNMCGFSHDPNLNVAAGYGQVLAQAFATLISSGQGTCAELTIDCKQIASCEAYNALTVVKAKFGSILSDLDYTVLGDPNIVNICQSDPCTVGAKTGKTCTYDGSNCASK